MTNANDSIHNSEQGTQDGLTKREYFAAMALQAVMSFTKQANGELHTYKTLADVAVTAADALIVSLNETNKTVKP